MEQFKLSEVNVQLWDKYNVSFTPHTDVNIIVGINGSGKTVQAEFPVHLLKAGEWSVKNFRRIA